FRLCIPKTGFGDKGDRPAHDDRTCLRSVHAVSVVRASVPRLPESGMAPVFPTAKCKVQSEPGLISQDLHRQLSREAHTFAVIVHQKHTQQILRTVLSY